ncbi:hypothetical protein Ae505Ps2_2411 [Pseudonocardia sp. Ae505_Ps2]|nr:hypothetical protein Ae505Ps2_2411 [Pseudonocardia sp. Ae505_Ps2]
MSERRVLADVVGCQADHHGAEEQGQERKVRRERCLRDGLESSQPHHSGVAEDGCSVPLDVYAREIDRPAVQRLAPS